MPSPLLSLLALLPLCGGVPGQAPPAVRAQAEPSVARAQDEPAPLEQRLVAACEQARRRYPLAGLSVAVLAHGELVFARGFGLADLEHEVPVVADTLFRVGSITKTFTAAAILARVERGELALAEDVARWLPELAPRGRTITLEALLSHTSGLANFSELPLAREALAHGLPREEIVRRIGAAPFAFEPGSAYAYSNSGFFLAGCILERVSGTGYGELVERELCRPLGLARTAPCADAPGPADAHGYLRRDGRFVAAPPLSMSLPFAAGALCSTAPELVRWVRALAQGAVIGAETFARMREPTQLADESRVAYGLGLALSELDGRTAVGHTGDINGFRAQLTYYPEQDLAVCVLANVDNAPVERIERALASAALGSAVEPARPAATTAPPSLPLERYAGRYGSPGTALRVLHDADGLAAVRSGETRFTLVHVAGDVFERADAAATRVVFELERGRVARLTWGGTPCDLSLERSE